MDKVIVTAKVIYQDAFWHIFFERTEENRLSVCKVTLGTEPREYEVQEFILKNYYRLRFSPSVAADVKEIKYSPKRMQREVHKQLQRDGIGTKSQQALKLQHEKMKTERKSLKREKREEEKQRQFDLKQLKRKEKHRGR